MTCVNHFLGLFFFIVINGKDFKDGVQNDLDHWVIILCWMAGKPVGDTKIGTEVVQVIEQDV